MQGAHHTVTKNLPYDECQRVPLIFCGRGIAHGERDNSLVCNGTDLLPTICQLAGIPLPAKTDGLSLADRVLGRGKAPQRKALYTEGDGFLNVISGTNKYTLFDGKNSGEMYIDLKSDNGELKNIISGNEAKAQTLKSFIPLEKLKPLPAKVKKEKVEKTEKRAEKKTGKGQRKGY